MRYLSAVCFLAIVAFADASPAAAQQNCACFCRVQGEGGGGCWVDVPGCNPRSGVRACNDGVMCGYNCGTPGLPARRSAPRAHPLGQHYRPAPPRERLRVLSPTFTQPPSPTIPFCGV